MTRQAVQLGYLPRQKIVHTSVNEIGQVFLLDKIKGEDFSDLTYFVGREAFVSTREPGMVRWRERLFALMARNSEGATDYFRLPAEKVFAIGIMIEL